MIIDNFIYIKTSYSKKTNIKACKSHGIYYTIVMELVILGKAIKDMKTISKTDRKNIFDKIELACSGDTSNVKKLTNHKPKYRLRVGDYRVLFDIEDDSVMVVSRILHRKDAYNK